MNINLLLKALTFNRCSRANFLLSRIQHCQQSCCSVINAQSASLRSLVVAESALQQQNALLLNLRRDKVFRHLSMAKGGKITPQCISAPMIPKKKIPTATPMFSRSRNLMKLFSLLCDASGSQKSKMAAHKQKYLYLSLYTT